MKWLRPEGGDPLSMGAVLPYKLWDLGKITYKMDITTTVTPLQGY